MANIEQLNAIAQKIKEGSCKRVALFCHVSPDLDCIGGLYAMRLILLALGKQADIFSHEPMTIEQKLLFDEKILKIGGFDYKNYDLLISIDTSTKSRLGEYKDGFLAHNNTIKIDHHYIGDENMAKLEYVSLRSSCCEIIYDLACLLLPKLTPEIATALYAGLSADTNSFVNSNVDKQTFETGAKLFEAGANILAVNDARYRNEPKSTIRMKKFLYSKFEYIGDNVALVLVPFDTFEKERASKQDCASFSSELVAIHGVDISCAIMETEPNVFDCSFRSMVGYDVSLIAQVLGGGGHRNAAGCKFMSQSPEEAKSLVINEINNYLNSRLVKND